MDASLRQDVPPVIYCLRIDLIYFNSTQYIFPSWTFGEWWSVNSCSKIPFFLYSWMYSKNSVVKMIYSLLRMVKKLPMQKIVCIQQLFPFWTQYLVVKVIWNVLPQQNQVSSPPAFQTHRSLGNQHRHRQLSSKLLQLVNQWTATSIVDDGAVIAYAALWLDVFEC